MAGVLTKGELIPEVVVNEMFNAVSGHSALARLSANKPIPFSGQREFIFSLDKEVDIVAENGKKTPGGGTVTPVNVVPIKFEYSMRTSDEFLYADEEYRLGVTEQFVEGFGKKLARGIDIAAFHGVNPRTGSASAVVGGNNFTSKVTNTVAYAPLTPDDNLDTAVSDIRALGLDVSGIAMNPAFASAMAKVKVNGVVQYPEFRFGQNPQAFAGMANDVNNTVSFGGSALRAVVGDFMNCFRWGYAKEIPLQVIEYGNPDNDEEQGDLKGRNQVLLRCEAYVGWGILLADAFVRIIENDNAAGGGQAAGGEQGSTGGSEQGAGGEQGSTGGSEQAAGGEQGSSGGSEQTAVTYTEVSEPTGNPAEQGWYEYDTTDEEYVLTEDVTVNAEKTYYVAGT